MCGIAGILSNNTAAPIENIHLQKLDEALRHRGPDDHGVWRSGCGQAAFVHTRLSILDLSAAGHQPMSLPGGRFTITFNGEIYNFQELRDELRQKGVTFQTGTDTEVILRLYEQERAGCLGRLRGMYAFAIWDDFDKSCFVARDPLGIKPLYFSIDGGRFSFASELRALQEAGLTSREIDASALADYFETGSVPEPQTLVKNARCLTPGHHLIWRDGSYREKSHWEFSVPSDSAEPANAPQLLREALLDSVRRHFVSDVPVGIFLSGGIDSTALLSLARHLGHERVSTFSIGVDDPSLDESGAAKRTAAHFGSDHHEMRLDEASGMKLFEDFTTHIDQPSIDGFNTFTVSRFARQHGMKVVLSGLGSDEMFAGYPSFIKVPQLVRAAHTLGIVPGVRRKMGRWLEFHAPSNRIRRLGTFFASDPCVSSAMRAFRGIFPRRDAVRLAALHAGVDPASIKRMPRLPEMPLPTLGDEVSRHEITHYMRNQLLKDSDVMSMSHGLELRVPFVDHTLLDSVTRIPSATRLQPGKKILLAAVPEVPEWVANQPKRGFLFPYQKWATSTWGPLFEKNAAVLGIPQPTWYQQWSKFMLDQWLEQRGIASRS